MCTQICSYILERWQNFTVNTKYLSPHSSKVGRPFYRATGRTLLSIILAAFVRYEYEERGGFSSPLVISRLCERALPSKRLHLLVIVEPCVAGEQLDFTVCTVQTRASYLQYYYCTRNAHIYFLLSGRPGSSEVTS